MAATPSSHMPSYQQLLKACSAPYLSEPAPVELPDELSLQSLWFNGQFGKHFTDTEGRKVEIVQFGFWNHASGPDFLHAAIRLDGNRLSGAIELDSHTKDWENHQHHSNPVYNSVVLHVVFADLATTYFTRSENHQAIPRILVPPAKLEAAMQHPRFARASSSIGRCHYPLKRATESQVHELLQQAAHHRCQLKAKRFAATVQAHSFSQALWVALASTLGYSNNRDPMTLLAQRLPIHQLSTQQEFIPSLLFGVAGFLTSKSHSAAPEDTQSWLDTLWSSWWKLRTKYELSKDRAMQWNYSGNRPVNHPHRRVAALAAIASHWPKILSLSSSPRALAQYLNHLEDPFWNHHHTLQSKMNQKKLALIGKQRAHDFLINHLLPFAISQGQDDAQALYHQLAAPSKSQNIKRVAYRLFAENPVQEQFLRKAWHHQALLQIYQDFCLEDNSDCHSCPFPEQLKF
ncbi:DUF2851 family protein [Rubritalea marina]|uniref:DUF2851 family protein n=1 Tax=Rubritalea marina TaxID=361055 RepID=UPI00035D5A4D|nr:DUF2851 family protein [Rubritalea marina]